MNRYIAHIELNHPNYENFCELSAHELMNAQAEAIKKAATYVQIANCAFYLDRPLFNVFRITIYEKTLEFTEKGIATYQSISQRISEKFGFYEHYTDIVHFANSHFYKVVY